MKIETVLERTNGFDDDDIIGGAFTEQNGVVSDPGDSAEVTAGRWGSDERRWVHSQPRHPGLVSKQGACRMADRRRQTGYPRRES